MAISVPKLSFAAGEISPMVMRRGDLQWLASAAKLSRNFIATPWGPPLFSPGFRYVGNAKAANKRCRLVPFRFSVAQAYILEFGDTTLRFFKDEAQIISGSAPYEVTGTPWAEANLADLRWAQSADVLYVVDGVHKPQKLSRTGHTSWTRTAVDFVDGPYYAENITTTTLDPDVAGPGAVNIVASSTTGINGGLGFQAGDVGRHLRLRHSVTQIGWGTITAVNSTTDVNVNVVTAFGGTSAVIEWRLGLWSDTTGWPRAVVIHQGRLGYASNPLASLPRVDLSKSGDFDTFTPGTTDDTAIALVLATGDVSVLYNLDSLRDLIALGAGKESKIAAASLTEPLAPANAEHRPVSAHGSANVRSELAASSVIMVQRDGRTLRQFTYSFEQDGYVAKSLMWRAEHMFKRQAKAIANAVREIAWQQEPWSTLWACDTGGWLYGLTFAPEQDVYAWHPHARGRTAAGAIECESIAVIPYGNADQLWACFKVTGTGGVQRQIAFLEDALGYDDPIEEAFHLDLGLTLDNTGTVVGGGSATLTPGTGATIAGTAGVTFTAGAASFAGTSADVGKFIRYRYVDTAGFPPDGRDRNGFLVYKTALAEITAHSSTTVVTCKVWAAWPALTAIAAADWRLSVTTITGLGHLEGQTVKVLGDGAPQADRTVSSGAITLEHPACTVHVGLGYTGILVPARLDPGGREGTAQGRPQHEAKLAVDFLRTMGGRIFRRRDDGTALPAETIPYRRPADLMDVRLDLFTGWKQLNLAAGWDLDPDLVIEQHLPLPMILRAIVPWTEVGRR